MSDLANALRIHIPTIEQLIDKCKDKPTGLVQPTVDEIVELALRENLAYKRRVFPRSCGIHPSSRAGTGVDPFNAQNLAKKISWRGFSFTKLENPMGFEARDRFATCRKRSCGRTSPKATVISKRYRPMILSISP